MNSAKPSPKESTKARQARDKREYERLVEEIKSRLEHRSPGLWDWWDKTVDAVKDWAGDAWDKVTTTTSNIANTVKDWTSGARDTVTTAVGNVTNKVSDAVSSAWDKVTTTTSNIANKVGSAIGGAWGRISEAADTAYQKGKDFVEDASEKFIEDVDKYADDTKKVVDKVTETVTDTVTTIVEKTGDIINNISLALGVGFDAAMAALAGLPLLLSEWKVDLTNFLTFDINEFMGVVNAIKEAARPEGMPMREEEEGK